MAPERRQDIEKRPNKAVEERVDVRRRRLGQAALGSVPVLLALQHRSVRAQTGHCMTVSAFSSMNVSNLNRPYACTGQSPSAWGSSADSWAGTGIDPGYYENDEGVLTTGDESSPNNWEQWLSGTRFRDVYGDPTGVFTNVDGASELSMMQVLWLGANDYSQIGGHFVAGMLNHLKGWADPYDQYTLRDIWSQYATTGTYTPPGTGDVWDTEMIKAWLARSWGEVLPV